jgi:hypothetical protein
LECGVEPKNDCAKTDTMARHDCGRPGNVEIRDPARHGVAGAAAGTLRGGGDVLTGGFESDECDEGMYRLSLAKDAGRMHQEPAVDEGVICSVKQPGQAHLRPAMPASA